MLAAANRRKSERRLCRSLAKIQFGTGGLPRDCVITDISAGGVKIVAEHLEPPSEFTLIFDTGLPPPCPPGLADRVRVRCGVRALGSIKNLERDDDHPDPIAL